MLELITEVDDEQESEVVVANDHAYYGTVVHLPSERYCVFVEALDNIPSEVLSVDEVLVDSHHAFLVQKDFQRDRNTREARAQVRDRVKAGDELRDDGGVMGVELNWRLLPVFACF